MAKIKFPEFWDIKQVKDIAFTTAGGTPFTGNRDFWGGNIPWMNSGELNLKTVRQVEGRITEKGLDNSSTKLIPKHCVLIGLAGQGKTRGTVATNEIELCTNQSIAAIFPGEDFNHKYLYYNLELRYQELRDLSDGGGGRGGLNLSLINNLEIPLPKLSEQKAIAEALSDIDDLISNTESLIEKLKNTKASVCRPLVLGENRLEGFTGKWEEKTLNDLLKYEQPTKYLVNTTQHLETGLVPVLTAGKSFLLGYTNDTYGVYQAIPTILFDDFTTAQKYVDFPFKVKSSACKMLTLINPKHSLRFLSELMSNIEFLPYDHKRYWISEYSKIRVMIPNSDEQDAIAQVISDFDFQIETLTTELEKYEWLKQGMMNDLLTGKVRLV